MKVKVTATVTYETELFPEDYEDFATIDQVIAWETANATSPDPEVESSLLNDLIDCGDISDFKIEKIAEAAPAQSEAA